MGKLCVSALAKYVSRHCLKKRRVLVMRRNGPGLLKEEDEEEEEEEEEEEKAERERERGERKVRISQKGMDGCA